METLGVTGFQYSSRGNTVDTLQSSCEITISRGKRATIGYVNAGGRGTRLNDVFTPNPHTGIAKALLEIGHPAVKLVDHHITNLRQQDVEKVVIAAGDQAELYEYVQDQYYDDKSVEVTKSIEQLGTGGDLVMYARTLEMDEPLLVQNVDTIIDINLHEFSRDFANNRRLGAVANIALTLNTGVPNEGAFLVGANGQVITSAEFNAPLVNAAVAGHDYRGSSTGVVMASSHFLKNQSWNESDGQLSLYRDCLSSAWRSNGLYAYNNYSNFFRDVGTVTMWLESQSDPELQMQLRYNNQQSSYSTKEN